MIEETLGSYIRKLREDNNMPLRRLAAHLDIDQSTLSKIETNQRHPTKEMIPILARVFKKEVKELRIKYLSERILNEVQNETEGIEAINLAKEIMIKSRKK